MLTLGIDLGTTKVAAVLYDTENPEAGCAVSAEHHAASSGAPGCAEQNAEIMYEAVLRLLAELPSQKLTQVKAIGLTGQMHSVVLWNNSEVSPIVTWQDKRASAAGHLEEFRSSAFRWFRSGDTGGARPAERSEAMAVCRISRRLAGGPSNRNSGTCDGSHFCRIVGYL